jgi:hypothetical protein
MTELNKRATADVKIDNSLGLLLKGVQVVIDGHLSGLNLGDDWGGKYHSKNSADRDCLIETSEFTGCWLTSCLLAPKQSQIQL